MDEKGRGVDEAESTEKVEELRYLRFTKNQVIQHIILFIVFIILAVTGLCLTFRQLWISQLLVDLMGGWVMRLIIHRVAGVIVVVLGVYHVVWAVFDSKFTWKEKLRMLPTKKDIRDFFQYLKYIFGMGKEPHYDRFSWKEKADYWGALWGMVLMGGTGLMMMFPVISTAIFDYSFINLSRILHSHESTIAISFIVIWHIYNVHFTPSRTKGVWLHGYITHEEMEEHHPHELEYFEITGKKPVDRKL